MAAAALAVALAGSPAEAVTVKSGFKVRTLASVVQPISVAWGPDGRMFVATKTGLVYAVDPGHSPRKIVDISGHVNTYSDRGLEGIAVDSDFATNHYLWMLYVYEPGHKPDDTGPKTSRLTRVTVHPDDTASKETVVLGKSHPKHCPAPSNKSDCIPAENMSHMVGTVRSAPDGTLWVGSGDGSNFDIVDPLSLRAQNERSYAGKIVHVDRAGHGLPGHPFCRPGSGPDDLTRVCAKVYAKGLRNPYRFSFRPGGGLVAGDVGWATQEEIDVVFAGRNYGWPCYEGGAGTAHGAKTPRWRKKPPCKGKGGMYSLEGTSRAAIPPVFSYPHGQTAAIIGGPVFPGGGGYPAAFGGKVFFADFPSSTISTFDPGTRKAKRFASGAGAVDLELAPNGHLVYVDIGAEAVREIAPAAAGR
jgi:glucose/arabinose dehydrogenase